ncbi:MAG: N,N-dimethylformamidase beta subunit family domain-containing protein [Ilumatobacteraceae bacterium]
MSFETVAGYCWPQSVAPGGTVALHLSSSGGREVHVEVARVGWRREVVWAETVPAGDHPTPLDASAQGCHWPAAVTIDADPSWRSGYYEVVLTIDLGGRTRRDHAFFVLRPPADSPNTILLQLATNTWHAYNDFGGRNLYTGGTHSALQRPMARGYLSKPAGAGRRVTTVHPPDPDMNTHVGYLRLNHLSPYAGSAGWPDWELPFLQWAEREGYGIDVVTNADLEDHPRLVDGYRLLLSVGHDEYWSGPMRDTVEAFIAKGGNVAFLSGNTAFWQVRLEDRTAQGPAATMVGYKGMFKNDPVYGTDRQGELTSIWSDVLVGRPENQMTGVSFTHGGYHRIGKRVTRGAGGYTVHRADHWLFEGTGLDYGDVLGAASTIVGYECDGCDFTYRDGLPYPTCTDGTPSTFQILGTAPAAHFTRTTAARPPRPEDPSELEFISSRLFGERGHEDRIAHGHAVLGAYTSPAGGTVITSGCTDWAHGLAGRDEHVERITANILDRLG